MPRGTRSSSAIRSARAFRTRRERRADSITAPPVVADSALTLRRLGEKFLDRYSRARGKASIDDDGYMLAALCRFRPSNDEGALGDRPLTNFTADDAEQFLESLKAQGRAGSTYNHYRQLLLNLFRWGMRKGFIARNPMEFAELPRQPQAKRSRRITDSEEAALLAAAAQHPHVHRLIFGALETGCRQGELLQLRWRDVNLDRQELRVRAEHAKDAEERVIPISARLHAVLQMARTAPDGEELGAEAFVFGDATGAPITTFKRAWHATILHANGITPDWRGGHGKLTRACVEALRRIDLHFHDLRHEAGSRWLEGGMPIHHVKELLGHANIRTTDTYLNATRLGLRESMRKYEESRKSCTNVAQTESRDDGGVGSEEWSEEPEVSIPSDLIGGGVDGARTRDLRRDTPAL